MNIPDKNILISVILIIILGFVLYYNTLDNPFVWDDNLIIKHNTSIRDWTHLGEIFTHGLKTNDLNNSSVSIHYRPFQILTYLIDYSFWKLNPIGYRLTNLLLHILVTLSIYWLITLLFNNRMISLFTSLFFIIHPVNMQPVIYISDRPSLLSALFILICTCLYIKQHNQKNTVTYFLMIISYILALLSKEYSLVLPLILLLYNFAFKKKINKFTFSSISILTLFYIILRITLSVHILSKVQYSPTLFERLPGFFVAIINYLKLLILPINLHPEYGKVLFKFINFKTIIGIIVVLFLLIYAFIKRDKNKLISFSIFWFFIALLPVSNIFYTMNAYMSDHWLYLPSLGFFLILAKSFTFLYNNKKLQLFSSFLIIFISIFYFSLTIRQTLFWENPISFYKRILQYNTNSARVYNNLGVNYANKGEHKKSIFYYKKAIKIDPNFTDAYINLGNVYLLSKDYKNAVFFYKKARALNPQEPEIYYYLSIAYYLKKEYQKAIKYLDKTINMGFANIDSKFKKLIDTHR